MKGSGLLSALFLATTCVVGTAQTVPIRVFVTPPIRDGFIDTTGGIGDSVKDVQSRLTDKGIVLARTRDEADLVVTVRGRGKGAEAYGALATANPVGAGAIGMAFPIPIKSYWVAAELQAGEFRTSFVGTTTDWESGTPWSSCAKAIAKDVAEWIKSNEAQLKARRAARSR